MNPSFFDHSLPHQAFSDYLGKFLSQCSAKISTIGALQEVLSDEGRTAHLMQELRELASAHAAQNLYGIQLSDLPVTEEILRKQLSTAEKFLLPRQHGFLGRIPTDFIP